MENITCSAGLTSAEEIMATPFESISEKCNKCSHFKSCGEFTGCEFTFHTHKMSILNDHEINALIDAMKE